MNLFKKKKAGPPPATDPNVVISNIRDKLTMLDKREEQLLKRIQGALADAKAKSSKKDKNGALFCLKKKKMLENEVAKMQGARLTLESQVMSLESATVNVDVLRAVGEGTKAMKQIRGNLDADTVHDMMDDMEEEKEMLDEISNAISAPAQDMFDDQNLLDELAELEGLEVEEKLMAAPAAPTPAAVASAAAASASATAATSPSSVSAVPNSIFNLPMAPTGKATVATEAAAAEEAAALRELEASMCT